MDLEVVAALRHLDMVDCDEVVAVAEEEVARGRRSPALLMLAALSERDRHHEADALLRRALYELGIPQPEADDTREASVRWVRVLIRQHARQIVAGNLQPAEGAAKISRFFGEFAPAPQLDDRTIGFLGLWSQWDEDTEGRRRQALEADIVTEAERLLSVPIQLSNHDGS